MNENVKKQLESVKKCGSWPQVKEWFNKAESRILLRIEDNEFTKEKQEDLQVLCKELEAVQFSWSGKNRIHASLIQKLLEAGGLVKHQDDAIQLLLKQQAELKEMLEKVMDFLGNQSAGRRLEEAAI